ncbi:hypothetical protein ACWOFR_18395 [Carnobacterium gallinarum]|uniref:hypothetical protein n=1 Tax=Carnobacterium gallinarum TaxID=2749 RepID=UPI0009FBEE10|nr:hypothetical protein [Carnobacterium gallinarum]
MELRYEEIKESAIDTYERLYINAKYPIEDTFYAFLGDFELNENYDKTEETSLYVSFVTLLIDKKQNFDFLRSELVSLMSDNNLKEIINNLESDEVSLFCKDVDTTKEQLK